ncbi:PREDICTED: zinc finger SWIM domain-containing protein 3 [Calidris pugnax]|uniref:zinc finger SWIM domain-containing protein 3 n=1 Tax=Calidris pugnax TaxID=198806 RepID=UPI00071E2409|nr:PREDICTED: zinc finger SWIM domain-containing protein 3 [Calidris pugnax]
MESAGPVLRLGSAFRSYEDFRQCFRAYELAQGYNYDLRSCVSVRGYNRQHGTAVRKDITFMQVKFGCSWTQTHSTKKRKEPISCPAYFELQYKEDIDQLVISDLNTNHVHSETVLSLNRAAAAATAKLCEEQQWGGTNSVAVADKDLQTVAGQPVDGVTAPAKKNASVLARLAEVMKTFLRVDGGSLASASTDSSHSLDRFSFQTSKMYNSFVKFPKSLLLHRVLDRAGHVLYAFIAETKERVGKVVHLSLLKDDVGPKFRRVLTVFKEFNPEWKKVEVFFVDMSFRHKGILKAYFPSAQVLPSIYHTVRLLKDVKEEMISSSFKQKLRLALRKALFAPSAANWHALSKLAEKVVSPVAYKYLQTEWFPCEPLWDMHTERGLQFCSTHMASLDLITLRISNLFGRQPSFEASVFPLMERADYLDSKGWESPSWGFLSTKDLQSGLWEKSKVCTGAAAELGPVFWENCPALGCWLCPQEWEVVRRSAPVVSPVLGGLSVRLKEDAQGVSQNYQSCACGFHRRYRLPCRHVLAVLQSHRRPVEESMVCRRWQRSYRQLLVPGATDPPGCSGGSVGGQLEDQQLPVPGAADPPGCSRASVGGQLEAREERIRSLSLELVNLLMQCDGDELEERGSALITVLAAWTRSPGEAAGNEPVSPHYSW